MSSTFCFILYLKKNVVSNFYKQRVHSCTDLLLVQICEQQNFCIFFTFFNRECCEMQLNFSTRKYNFLYYFLSKKSTSIITWYLITVHNRWLSVNYGTSKKRKLKKKKKERKKWNNRAFLLKTIHWNKRYNGPSAQLKSPHKTTVRPNQRKRLSKKKEEKKKRELLQYNNMAPSCVIEWPFD